jgi:hypothetical protein
MATTGKIHKVVWRNIPDDRIGTWHQHLLGTFVIDPNGNLLKSEICVKAMEQVTGGLYNNTKEWMECRGPFTHFNPEIEDEKILASEERGENKYLTLREYLIATEPIIKEVTNIVVVSSALDG